MQLSPFATGTEREKISGKKKYFDQNLPYTEKKKQVRF